MFPNQVRMHAFNPKILHKFFFYRKILDIRLRQVKKLIRKESLWKFWLTRIIRLGFEVAQATKRNFGTI